MACNDAPANDSWVASIHRSPEDFDPIGTGVVVDRTRVLTCTHVVAGVADDDDVWVRFPKAVTMERRRVSRRIHAEPPQIIDMTVLHLDSPVPAGVRPAPLKCPAPKSLRGQRWWAYGFAGGDPVGNSADGRIGESLGYGWVRLDTHSSYKVEGGFSGGGVWCPRYNAVVAVVGHDNERGDGRAMTLSRLDDLFPAERFGTMTGWWVGDAGGLALAAWGWQLAEDKEAARHWKPRARGVAVDSERGFRFRGRHRALSEIVGWLDRPTIDRRVLVVTGSPGVGKSAVLGRVVTTADAELRKLLPPNDEALRASVGSIGCAVHANGKTALDVAVEIARAASAEIPTAIEDVTPLLRTALEERPGARFNVVIDALDEAASGAETRLTIEKVALVLAQTCADVGAQVVVGCRRHDGDGDLLEAFGMSAVVIDLDRSEYFASDDLAAYALSTLQLEGDERQDSPYSDLAVAEPVARRIAALADRNFLVAGLVARDHGLNDVAAATADSIDFTPSVETALSRFVARVRQVEPFPCELALTALAFAEAPGLSAHLWAVVIKALSGASSAEDDVTAFAKSSAANFLVEHSESADRSTFRLFHQALNDALLAQRRKTHSVRADEAAITRALLAEGRLTAWMTAQPYLLRSLAGHAGRAGLVDELLLDEEYLLRADLRRLLPLAHTAQSTAGQQRTRLLLLTPEAVTADIVERAALLSITEVLEGVAARIGSRAGQRYRGRWGAARRRAELATLSGHTSAVNALCALVVGHNTLLASASDDTTVRLWDPANADSVAIMSGHTAWVGTLCVLDVEGYTIVASGSADTMVRLWDTNGKAIATLAGHAQSVRSLCALRVNERTLLASGSDDRTVRLWDPAAGQQLAILRGHSNSVRSLCALRVDKMTLLASGSDDRTVRLWNPANAEWLATVEGHAGASSGDLRPMNPASGKGLTTDEGHGDWVRSLCAIQVGAHTLLASGSDDKTVQIWDPKSRQTMQVLTGHTDRVRSLCAFPDGERTLLASGGDDRTLRIWDPVGGEHIHTLVGHTAPLSSLCALPFNVRTMLASGSNDGTVRLWDPIVGQPIAVLKGHASSVRALCALRVGDHELVGSAGDTTLRLWDPASDQATATVRGHTDSVHCLCVVKAGRRSVLASGGQDGTVRLWDLASGKVEATLEGHTSSVRALCSVKLGRRTLLASSGDDKTVRLWDPVSGAEVATLRGHTSWVRSLCALQVGEATLLASAGGDRAVRLWNPVTFELEATMEGHTDWIASLSSFREGKRVLLASASDDKTVRLWDPATREAIALLQGHTDWVVSLCPFTLGPRALLASGGDKTVRVWDPQSGAGLACFDGHTSPVTSLCTLEVGERTVLASGSSDNTVRIWDPATEQSLQTFMGHRGTVVSLCKIQVGERALLASASTDKTIRIWDPANGGIELVVPVSYEPRHIATVEGGLAVALTAGVLVMDLRP